LRDAGDAMMDDDPIAVFLARQPQLCVDLR
jgi:hypothetical protein